MSFSLNKILHDSYAGLASGLGIPLKRVSMGGAMVQELKQQVIQAAGRSVLDNRFESSFLKNERHDADIGWEERSFYEIPGAWVTGEEANVFLPDGTFFDVCPSLKKHPERKIRRPVPALAKKVSGPVFSLAGRNHENHGHFIFQHIPRYLAARKLLESYPGCRFLLGTRKRAWQLRYLEAVGIPAERCIYGSPGTLRIERLLYVPQLWSRHCFSDPEYCRELGHCFTGWAESVLKGPLVEAAQPPIFISREDAPNRRLLNEAELVAEIKAQWGDCEVLVLSKMPFAEQLRKFASTPLVVGGLGQGFTNLLVSRNALCLILDWVPQWTETPFSEAFRDLALIGGNRVTRLFLGKELSKTADWVYPPKKFAKELERLTSLHRE